MTTISLTRLKSLLDDLALGEATLAATTPGFAKLLARQRRLDRLANLLDDIESRPDTEFGVSDDPRTVTEAMLGRLDASEPRPPTWFAGSGHLRRRVDALAQRQSSAIESFVTTPHLPPAEVVVQLIVLFACLEPGVTAEAIRSSATSLALHTTL